MSDQNSSYNNEYTSNSQSNDPLFDEENRDKIIPVLPLKDIVVFPSFILPLFVGRSKSILAIEHAQKNGNKIVLLTQKEPDLHEISPANLYKFGVFADILQVLKLPDGTIKVLVEAKHRIRAERIAENNFLVCLSSSFETLVDLEDNEIEAIKRRIIEQFSKLGHVTQKIPEEVVELIKKVEKLEYLIDVLASQIIQDTLIKQEILQTQSLKKRSNALIRELEKEIDILDIEKKIQSRVKQQIEKSQKQYYLQEQAKAIAQELGGDANIHDDDFDDIKELETKIKKAKMPDDIEAKALKELKKLKLIPPVSSESSLIRNYIDMLIDLPWEKSTKLNEDLLKARKTLDCDHYGLEKIKERIIEYLAVQKRTKNNKSPILCFVGPPGVGKTSLAESIAKATGRKYTRIALGGLHDEAEIRGHRRTYIGAMPGRIIQSLAKIKVKNPLILLDEIDKLSSDYRGDPASAFLEVLDPEQNNAFVDNYLEVSFDLSEVFFIATANSFKLHPALLDRMEIIQLSGYTEVEKTHIVNNHLIKKQMSNNGLKARELKFDHDAVLHVIRHYTAEAGVRGLERQIGKICRKVVAILDTKKDYYTVMNQDIAKKQQLDEIIKLAEKNKILITKDNVNKFLGVISNDFDLASKENRIGRVTGLAWTEIGGDILTIEVIPTEGKGQIIRTGKLGEVMQESIQAAASLVKSMVGDLGIKSDFFEKHDLHIHIPEGATPKDGPSAGIAITVAIISAIIKIPVYSSLAMTGEVTLYGEVLPIGGLKEKLLAAIRSGIKKVLIPEKNTRDLDEITHEIISNLEIIAVAKIESVLAHALEKSPFEHKDGISELSNNKNVQNKKSSTKKKGKTNTISH